MPLKPFDPSESTDAVFEPTVSAKESGTVLKAFNGPMRRFVVDYVVTDADVPDLPMSRENLKAGSFIA